MPALLLSLLLPWASAADVGLVGVHDPTLSIEQQDALMQAFAEAIETSTRHDALLPARVAEGYAGREDLVLQDTFLAEGRRRMEDGRLLYQQAEHTDAVVVLEVAVRTLDDNVRWARSIRDLWEAWMLLGTAQLSAWLAEVRSGARARPVEANLSRGASGYNGTIVVTIGGAT